MQWLDRSLVGLRQAAPEMSAHTVLSRRQHLGLIVAGGLVVAAAVVNPMLTLQVLVALGTLMYSATLIYRLLLVRRGYAGQPPVRVTDQEAPRRPRRQLPVYSVLVPAYREPEVDLQDRRGDLGRWSTRRTNWTSGSCWRPTTRTPSTRPGHRSWTQPITIVLVPPAEPRTKPKACNFGLQAATGDLVTIFDAEDRPEPLQLRRAVVALAGSVRTSPACRPGWATSTARQNMVTRWFTIEYGHLVPIPAARPGLRRAPIPLGGTSNHFRARAAAGPWRRGIRST